MEMKSGNYIRILNNIFNWLYKYLIVDTELLILFIYYTALTCFQSKYILTVNSHIWVSCWLIIRTGCHHSANCQAQKEQTSSEAWWPYLNSWNSVRNLKVFLNWSCFYAIQNVNIQINTCRQMATEACCKVRSNFCL